MNHIQELSDRHRHSFAGLQVPTMHFAQMNTESELTQAAAADALRNYLKFAPSASDADAVKKQLDEVEKLSASAKEQQ